MKTTVVDRARAKLVAAVEDVDARDPGVLEFANAVEDNVELKKPVVILLVVVVIRVDTYDTRVQHGMTLVAKARAGVVFLLSDLHGEVSISCCALSFVSPSPRCCLCTNESETSAWTETRLFHLQ